MKLTEGVLVINRRFVRPSPVMEEYPGTPLSRSTASQPLTNLFRGLKEGSVLPLLHAQSTLAIFRSCTFKLIQKDNPRTIETVSIKYFWAWQHSPRLH